MLELVHYPDPRLHERSAPIIDFDDDLAAFAQKMIATMHAQRGIGLAAVQVGAMIRLITTCVDEENRVFCNPEITWASDETRPFTEGCLSIPRTYVEVDRPDRIRVRYQRLDGTVCEEDFSGTLATVLQHEIDHTNGVLFLQRVSRLKRERALKKAAKR